MAARISDVPHLVTQGRADPESAFPEIRSLAASAQWDEREVAATALVEISRKQGKAVITLLEQWATDEDANIRRTASEGLRHLARETPEMIVGILEMLRNDPALYVRKSVANILRNAGKRHPDYVLDLAEAWAQAGDRHTDWVIKEGLRKLRESHPERVEAILQMLSSRR